MTINDPISDMLTRVRNAIMAGQAQVAMPSSRIKAEIARILKEEGFLDSVDVVDSEQTAFKILRMKIKYVGERRERNYAGQFAWPPRVHQEDGYSLGALRFGCGHPVNAQGCHDRCPGPPVGRWRRDLVQGLVDGRSKCLG